MSFVITREYMISILEAWKNDQISVIDVYDTITELYNLEDELYIDWELEGGDDNGNNNSITKEVLCALENLDMNFIIQDDIDHYVELLKTPKGKFIEGMQKLGKYKATIDYKKRERLLLGIYPYIGGNK